MTKELLIHQSVLVQSPYTFLRIRFFFLIGGYACGKTSALIDSLCMAISYFAGKKDKEGKAPKIGLCGITITFLKKTLLGGFLSVLRSTRSVYSFDKAQNIIYIAGVEIHITPIKIPEDIFGYDWCAAFIDELDELPAYSAVEVVTSVNDRCRQHIQGCREPFMVFATTSQGLKGTYTVIQDFKKKNIDYFIVRGRTKDNTNLPKDYVESMYKIYNDKEIECLLEGKFISIESGRVFPEYNEIDNKHIDDLVDKLEDNEEVIIGQDFNKGFNKAVAIVIRNGEIFAVKDFIFESVTDAPSVFRTLFPTQRISWVPDATSNDVLPTFKAELRANNIRVVYRKKNPLVADRVFAINKLFRLKLLWLCPLCKELSNDLVLHINDKDTGRPAKGVGEKAPDHMTDAFAYAVYYAITSRPSMKEAYNMTLKRRREIYLAINEDETEEVSRLVDYGGDKEWR